MDQELGKDGIGKGHQTTIDRPAGAFVLPVDVGHDEAS